MSESVIINPNRFADMQSSSFLPVSGRISGNEVWFAKTIDTDRMRIPLSIGIHGDDLVVSYGTLLAVLNRKDGSTVWKREITGNHVASMDEDGILNLDHAGYYVPLGYDGQLKKERPLVSITQETYLQFIRATDDEIMYGYQKYPGPVSEPGEKMDEPYYEFVRFAPDDFSVIWQHQVEGEALATLISKDYERIYLATSKQLYIFPSNISTLAGTVKTTDFTKIEKISVDHDGNVLLVELIEECMEIKQVSPEGETQWKLALEGSRISKQPPVSSPDGYIYFTQDNSLYQIREGDIVWVYKLPQSPDENMITVLADNSVLAAVGNSLVHVSATGEEILTKILVSPIGTRPVMDEKGRVYIGGEDGIRCLE
ncbi:MAG: hypothetical protein U9R56_06740 [candidate division Zixibacteria bacterium]|nr:hypothetical protein [candidate division Zixibacteria bacterium]